MNLLAIKEHLKIYKICEKEDVFPKELTNKVNNNEKIFFVPTFNPIKIDKNIESYYKDFYIVNRKIKEKLCQDKDNQNGEKYSNIVSNYNYNFNFYIGEYTIFYNGNIIEIGKIDKKGVFETLYHIKIEDKTIKPENEIKNIINQNNLDDYFRFRYLKKEGLIKQNLGKFGYLINVKMYKEQIKNNNSWTIVNKDETMLSLKKAGVLPNNNERKKSPTSNKKNDNNQNQKSNNNNNPNNNFNFNPQQINNNINQNPQTNNINNNQLPYQQMQGLQNVNNQIVNNQPNYNQYQNINNPNQFYNINQNQQIFNNNNMGMNNNPPNVNMPFYNNQMNQNNNQYYNQNNNNYNFNGNQFINQNQNYQAINNYNINPNSFSNSNQNLSNQNPSNQYPNQKQNPTNQTPTNQNPTNQNKTSIKQFNYVPMIGLENLGQTCYMNSLLQCFSNLYPITKYFLNPKKKETIESNIITMGDKNAASLSVAYRELIEKLWNGKPNTSFRPDKFKEILGKLNPLFKENSAGDSKDLALFLIMQLHNELNNIDQEINTKNQVNVIQQNNLNVNPYNQKEVLEYFFNDFRINHNSIITNTFYGINQSIFECQVCKMNNMQMGINAPLYKYNYENFFYLEFPLEEVRKFVAQNNMMGMNYQNTNQVSIDDCFNYNLKQNEMIGYCEKCGKDNARLLSFTQIYSSPLILMIVLNRGKGLQFNIKINFQDQLYVKTLTGNKLYELQSVVKHLGDSSASGHFISYCRSPIPSFHNQWYCYNDTTVVQANNWSNITDVGVNYILFYQLKQ